MLGASADTTVARVRLAEGRPTDALEALKTARATFEAWGTVPDQISGLLLAAAVHDAAGDRVTALADLSIAVRLGGPRRLRPPLRRRRSLAGVAARRRGRACEPAFAAKVRAALRDDEAPRGIVRRGTSVLVAPDGELVESLTAQGA